MPSSEATSTNMPGMDMPSSDMPGMDMGGQHSAPAPSDAATNLSHSLVLGGFGVLNTVILAIAWAWRQLVAPPAGPGRAIRQRRPRPSN